MFLAQQKSRDLCMQVEAQAQVNTKFVIQQRSLKDPRLPPAVTMPGTHLLPPNLLKLFAPRPPLPYARPVDRDIDRIRNKAVGGVADILKRLKDENTDHLFNAANADDAMEEGEEPVFTLAEETKRQIRREERKAKRVDDFKAAKESCMSSPHIQHFLFVTNSFSSPR